MRNREGLSQITANQGFNNYTRPEGYKVGKVITTILGPSSVPPAIWESNGSESGIGTILYQEYNENNIENDTPVNSLPTALPLFPNQKYYPLPGEIVLLLDLPSAPSPVTDKTQETYYLSSVNAWNSPQFNGLSNAAFDTFSEDPNFRGLHAFEGDYILEGRFGNSLRFGSSNNSGNQGLNPWSQGGLGGPITILSNSSGYIEDINDSSSALYLTSKQKLPVDIGNVKLSNITSPVSPKDYSDSQAVLVGNRVIISSKDDEVLVFGKSGVEVYSQGPIYLQSGKTGITIQDDTIFLGPSNDTQVCQPLILGSDLKVFLSSLSKALSDFCTSLSDVKSTPEGTPLLEVNAASAALQVAIKSLSDKLGDDNYLLSKTTYTL